MAASYDRTSIATLLPFNLTGGTHSIDIYGEGCQNCLPLPYTSKTCVNKTLDSVDIHGAICHEIHCFLNESGLGGNLPLPAHTNIECQDYLYFVLNIRAFYCILIP